MSRDQRVNRNPNAASRTEINTPKATDEQALPGVEQVEPPAPAPASTRARNRAPGVEGSGAAEPGSGGARTAPGSLKNEWRSCS